MLAQWDESLAPALRDKFIQSQQRREFLAGLMKTSAVISSWPLMGTLSGCNKDKQTDVSVLQDEPWQSLSVVQQHLFPADGNGPGAHDIHATQYLKSVLNASGIDEEERDFMLNGIGWLNGVANQQFGNVFKKLDSTQREQVLKTIAASEAGENWLGSLLLYIFEALLSSPVYGGNPGETGWRWLEHQPGFPQPSKDKRYFELLRART